MSDIAIRFRDQYSTGPQFAAFGYRPAWNEQYVLGQLSRYVRRVDLKSGTVLASTSLSYAPIAAAVIPQIPGSVAITPYNPSGPVFWLAITGDDGYIRVYDRSTLALVKTLAQPAGSRGILYAALAGIVFDGPNPGDLYYYNQNTDTVLSHALVPSGAIVSALWVPTSTAPEIHYTFDGKGNGRVFTFDGIRWNWAGSFSGAGLTDILRVWTDGSQSWPYYGLPTQMQVASNAPLGGGSVATYLLTDPLNPVYASTSLAQTPYQINDIAGGASTARTATEEPNGQFPLISEWKPMQTVIPADPGPDAIPLGITIHSDQGEWWLLGNSAYTPLYTFKTATAVFSSNGSVPDCHTYTVTPTFTQGTWTSPSDGTYIARFRVRGQTELPRTTGGTIIAGTGNHCVLNGTLVDTTWDQMKMTLSTGDRYWLNSRDVASFSAIDYAFAITLPPSTTITFRYDTIDGKSTLPYQNQINYMAADDDPGHPFVATDPTQGTISATQQIDLLSLVKVS